jgi:hypothetical protein
MVVFVLSLVAFFAAIFIHNWRTTTPEDEPPAPPERLIHDSRILERAHTIILVRVVEVTPTYATIRVLKSLGRVQLLRVMYSTPHTLEVMSIARITS